MSGMSLSILSFPFSALKCGSQQGGSLTPAPSLALFDTQIDSIQCLNFAQNLLNSIFSSKSFHENSIQKIIQILKNFRYSIQ